MFADIDSRIAWMYETEYNQFACQSLIDRRCHRVTGKVLGGSSSINGMVHVRGNQQDFNDWNIPGWTYDDMFEYFLRLESIQDYDQLPPHLKEYHNNVGPMKVSLLNASDIVWRGRFLSAYQEIGLPFNDDANGPSQTGTGILHACVYNGERQSTANSYLAANKELKTLNVAYNSFVTGIVFDDYKNTIGVTVKIGDNEELFIKANLEVILSTGSIKTPQLLMLSGIGPRNHLERHGIKVVVDSFYVGKNLQDHSQTPIILTANTGTATPVPPGIYEVLLAQWNKDRSGVLATLTALDVTAFVDTLHGSQVPDIQMLHGYVARNDSDSVTLVQKSSSLNNYGTQDIRELNVDSEIVMISPVVLRPNSRGFIKLSSSSPHDDPLIFSNLFSSPGDYATLLRGIRVVEKLLETEVFKANGVNLPKLNSLEECNELEFQSDEYWFCYHKHKTDTIFHPVGTAAVGLVVDTRLRVYGVQGLRVVDASVFRLIPRGNTNTPTIAVAEHAADIIGEDYGF